MKEDMDMCADAVEHCRESILKMSQEIENELNENEESWISIIEIQPFSAGPAGFEPSSAGVKVLCLTAWRWPIAITIVFYHKTEKKTSRGLATCHLVRHMLIWMRKRMAEL